MKKIIACSIIIHCFIMLDEANVAAQNVGIGTNTPTEKLHVNGNLNVTGAIKANGIAGQSGQVLMTNSSGNISWEDMTQYKNFVTFNVTGTWTVPAGVTRILVEAWGGGGGGTMIGGGGGGGYVRGVFLVLGGENISFTIGSAGAGSGTAGGNGGTTAVVGPGNILSAFGGFGSNFDVATMFVSPGPGGGFTSNTANYFGIRGDDGSLNRVEFQQRSETIFYEVSSGGDGGNSGNSNNTGGKGTYRVINTTGAVLIRSSSSFNGSEGGGGGGGYRLLSEGGFGNGASGGVGRVTIHY